MNQRADKPLQRGRLSQLLARAPRKRAKTLRSSSKTCDHVETVNAQPVKVLGPYRNASKWRLLVFDPDRQAKVFDDYETACAARDMLLSEAEGLSSKTVGDAVGEFLTYKHKRGCKERSILAIRHKLAWLPLDVAITSITANKAEALYSEQSEKVAVATHHANLRFTKALFKWCVKQKYISENPFADVETIGKANKGKLQLRQDEAKTLTSYLIEQSKDDYRALALLVQVLLGLRSGEVLNLRKRDLDCGGSLVVVDGTKTANAKRNLKLEDAPAVQELVARRVAPLSPESLIFAPQGREEPVCTTSLHKALRMFCQRAGVPKVCPHSLRGLHSSLAVQAGATCALVAQALGHGSDVVTRRHYIAPAALNSARSARVASALLGSSHLDGLIGALRDLPPDQLDVVCSAVGYRR